MACSVAAAIVLLVPASRDGSAGFWASSGWLSSWRLLFMILEQTTVETPSRGHHGQRYRYAERTRLLRLGRPWSCSRRRPSAVMWPGCFRPGTAPSTGPAPAKAGRKHFVRKRLSMPPSANITGDPGSPATGRGLLPARLRLPRDGQDGRWPWPISIGPSSATPIRRRPTSSAASSEPKNGDFDAALADFGQLMLFRANDPDRT